MNWRPLALKAFIIGAGFWVGWRLGTLEHRVDNLELFIGDHAGQHLEQLP